MLVPPRHLRKFRQMLRRQDLIRFGKFTEKWSSHPVLPGEESGYTTVFPIPADVLDLNPLLKQNPGY